MQAGRLYVHCFSHSKFQLALSLLVEETGTNLLQEAGDKDWSDSECS